MSQQQPSFSLAQTISLSETLSWIHGKHNLRFGGDYRRVHRDLLGGSNATGTFYFTGNYTGSSFGDFLLGEPQETSIDSAVDKSYLRENVFDLYAQDLSLIHIYSASDLVNLFPELGGKSSSDSNSVQAGYTVGYHKVTNIFNASWNCLLYTSAAPAIDRAGRTAPR